MNPESVNTKLFSSAQPSPDSSAAHAKASAITRRMAASHAVASSPLRLVGAPGTGEPSPLIADANRLRGRLVDLAYVALALGAVVVLWWSAL